jgi:uncharacterized RDD family membrane protein YckC
MSPFDPTFQIDTPENVSLGYDIAGLGTRFQAAIIDTLLIILALALAIFFFAAFLTGNLLEGWLLAILSLILFTIFLGYYTLFELIWNGQTPGKRWAGVRVVGRDGLPVSAVAVLVRNLVRLVDFMPVFYGLGTLVTFFSVPPRRLGDWAAGTLVVHERPLSQQGLARTYQPLRTPRTVPDEVAALPVERLNAADLLIAEEYLRRSDLTNRPALARSLLNHLYGQMALPAPDALRFSDAEELVRQLVFLRQNGGEIMDN